MFKLNYKTFLQMGGLLMLFGLLTISTHACLCDPIPVKQKVKLMRKEADAIFTGMVKSVSSESNIVEVTLKVEKSWKTKDLSEITIYTYGSCSVGFEKNKSYLVFAKNNSTNLLFTDMCMGTGSVSLSKKEIKLLGKPILDNSVFSIYDFSNQINISSIFDFSEEYNDFLCLM